MTETLKPCPFCGGEAKIDGTSWTTRDGKDQAWATCKKCGTYGPSSTDAIAAWNRRAEPVSVQEADAAKQLMLLSHPNAEILDDGDRITRFCRSVHVLEPRLRALAADTRQEG